MALALKLDEARLQELLADSLATNTRHASGHAHGQMHDSHGVPGSDGAVRVGGGGVTQQQAATTAQLMGCFGDLFTASLDAGWRSEGKAQGRVGQDEFSGSTGLRTSLLGFVRARAGPVEE